MKTINHIKECKKNILHDNKAEQLLTNLVKRCRIKHKGTIYSFFRVGVKF